MRDLYNDMEQGGLQERAWNFACEKFDADILAHLTGEDVKGNIVSKQHIGSLLNQCNNLGEFTPEEWEKFFIEIRENGI